MNKIKILSIITLFLLAACSDEPYIDSLRKDKVSYVNLQLHDDSRNRPLPTKVWFPTDQKDSEVSYTYNDGFVGVVAKNGSIKDSAYPYPIVLLSHGTGGANSNLSWLAEILASNGFIVAAPNHWNNTTRNNTPSGIIRLWDRPKDISFVLDYFLSNQKWSAMIDKSRAYAAGFSAGGYTVLALAGAKHSPQQIDAFCQKNPSDGVCKVSKGIDFSAIDFSDAGSDYTDPRIKAVFAMAPAIGKAITTESLKEISIPVRIVASQDDEWVDAESNAKLYSEYIGSSTLTLFEGGGHFVFMQECSVMAKIIVWLTVEEDVCGFNSEENRRKLQHRAASIALKLFGSEGSHNKRMQPTSG